MHITNAMAYHALLTCLAVADALAVIGIVWWIVWSSVNGGYEKFTNPLPNEDEEKKS